MRGHAAALGAILPNGILHPLYATRLPSRLTHAFYSPWYPLSQSNRLQYAQ